MREWILKTGDDKELYAREWQPKSHSAEKATAVVCFVHGMGEHSGRYDDLAEALSEVGIASLAYDQRGHGRSPGRRGHADSMEQLSGDVEMLIGEAEARFPGVPLFLYGHSMGGAVALHTALTRNLPLRGLILSSPWLRLESPPSRVAEAAIGVLSKLWPSLSQPTRIKEAELYRPGKHVVADSPMDDDCHTRITAAMYQAVSEAGRWSLEHGDELKLPTLLLHGTSDRITSFEASKELASRIGSHCNFQPFDGGFHELHHDLEREQLILNLNKWIYTNLDCQKSPPVL
ncbi:alpha/beta hydrolase [Paenibacillus herberti]|nr:alpha/beta hydrolase [Paenibacillus herberti]